MHLRPALLALWVGAAAGFAVLAAFAAAHDTFPSDVWLTHRLQDVHGGLYRDLLDGTAELVELPLMLPVWLGSALLQHSLEKMRRRGMTRVNLGVDGDNTRGAVPLHERAGMAVERRWDCYREEL